MYQSNKEVRGQPRCWPSSCLRQTLSLFIVACSSPAGLRDFDSFYLIARAQGFWKAAIVSAFYVGTGNSNSVPRARCMTSSFLCRAIFPMSTATFQVTTQR